MPFDQAETKQTREQQMVLKSQNSGDWSVKKLPVRLAFIVAGTVLLGLGLTHLAQTSNGGQVITTRKWYSVHPFLEHLHVERLACDAS